MAPDCLYAYQVPIADPSRSVVKVVTLLITSDFTWPSRVRYKATEVEIVNRVYNRVDQDCAVYQRPSGAAFQPRAPPGRSPGPQALPLGIVWRAPLGARGANQKPLAKTK